jgi:apolipoprotein N-acyltransferase
VLNQGIVWDPETGGGDRYTKRTPVPFGEYIPWRDTVFRGTFGKLRLISRDMLAGARTTPLQIGAVDVAAAICFDVAYDQGIREQLTRGGELLVVQTSNATFARTSQIDQQFAITRLRAIESGRVVVVAATNGITGIIAADGTVLSQAPRRQQEVLVETVPLSTSVTPGVRIGPWIARASTVITVAALIWIGYRRPHRPGSLNLVARQPHVSGLR